MMSRIGANRSFAKRLTSVTRMLSVVFLLAFVTGCASEKEVHYLRHQEKVIHLKKGESAPHDGWLLSDSQLAELYDLLSLELAEK